jgi:outer membrane autotransporter protein
MALIVTTLGSIPGALAQISFSSFSPPSDSPPSSQPSSPPSSVLSSQQSGSTDQAVATTTQGAVRSQAKSIVGAIGNHIRDIVLDILRRRRGADRADASTGLALGGETGLSAGSDDMKYSAWADLSGSYLKDSAGGTNAYQGWSQNYLAGLDTTLADSWVVGLSAGYVRADFGVPSLNNGSRHDNGQFIGPYVSYIIGEHYSVDASFNYTQLQNDVFSLAVPPFVPANTRHFGSQRYTYALNGNYYRDIGPYSIVAFAGWTYSLEHQKGSADSTGANFSSANVRYGAWRLGGEFSYNIDNFEPYLPIAFEHEVTTPVDGTGRSAIVIGAGLRYRLGDAIKLGLLFSTVQDKKNQRDDTVAANFRLSF